MRPCHLHWPSFAITCCISKYGCQQGASTIWGFFLPHPWICEGAECPSHAFDLSVRLFCNASQSLFSHPVWLTCLSIIVVNEWNCRPVQLLNHIFSFSVTPEKSDLVVSEVQMILVSHSLWNLSFYHGPLPPPSPSPLSPPSLFPFLSASPLLCNSTSFLLPSVASRYLISTLPLPVLSLR